MDAGLQTYLNTYGKRAEVVSQFRFTYGGRISVQATSGHSHLSPATRPNINYAAKPLLRYVKGTSNFGIMYGRSKDPRLIGYIDSDWASFVDDRKSTSRYVFSLRTGAVTWTRKTQQVVALSSIETKYRRMVKAASEAICLQRMLSDMQMSQAGPSPLFCGNQGLLKLAKNPIFHERTKHAELRCHFIHQLVED